MKEELEYTYPPEEDVFSRPEDERVTLRDEDINRETYLARNSSPVLEEMMRKENSEILENALVECLDEREREILRQRFEEGKNLQEVGNFFGLNYSTISIIQRTAILKLRRYFDKKEESKIKPVDSGVIRAANDREVLLEIKKRSDQRERFDIEFSGKVEEVKEKKEISLSLDQILEKIEVVRKEIFKSLITGFQDKLHLIKVQINRCRVNSNQEWYKLDKLKEGALNIECFLDELRILENKQDYEDVEYVKDVSEEIRDLKYHKNLDPDLMELWLQTSSRYYQLFKQYKKLIENKPVS